MDFARTRAGGTERGIAAVRPAEAVPGRAGSGEVVPPASPTPALPVPVAGHASRPERGERPAAASSALLAQLIATRLGLEQTRRLRRAPAGTARHAYETARALGGAARPTRSVTV